MRKPDPLLLGLIVALSFVGLLVLYSASLPLGLERFQDPFYFIKKQLVNGYGVGLILFVFGYIIPWRRLNRLSLFFFVASIALLALVFIPPFRSGFKEAARWITIGPLSFQPAEFVKLTLIVYLASWLPKIRQQRSLIGTLVPFVAILSLVGVLLIAQPALGNLIIISFIGFVMFFASGARLSEILALGLVVTIVIGALIFIVPYRLQRFFVFLNPNFDPQGVGYQLHQARIAIGSGGMFGKGFGHSESKLNYLPEAIGDSAFAVYAEEFGFVGSLVLFILFFLLANRIVLLGLRGRDSFAELFAIGLSSWILIQAFVHIGSISGAIPMSGIPLPFVSYGGSALASLLGGLGIMVNISRSARR